MSLSTWNSYSLCAKCFLNLSHGVCIKSKLEVKPQIYKGDPRACVIFILAWGLDWGGLPVIKLTMVRQVCMSPASAVV